MSLTAPSAYCIRIMTDKLQVSHQSSHNSCYWCQTRLSSYLRVSRSETTKHRLTFSRTHSLPHFTDRKYYACSRVLVKVGSFAKLSLTDRPKALSWSLITSNLTPLTMDYSSGMEPVKLLAFGGLSHSPLTLSLTGNILARRWRHSWAFRAAHNQTNYAQGHDWREHETEAGWKTTSYLSSQAMRLLWSNRWYQYWRVRCMVWTSLAVADLDIID